MFLFCVLLQLDLAGNQLCGLNWNGEGTYTEEGIKALADAVAVNASLTSCNVLKNSMDVAAAHLLVTAVKDKDVSLCGIKTDQTTASFSHWGLEPCDAVLLASDLSKAGVSASLTSLVIHSNELGDEGIDAMATALKESSTSKLVSLDVRNNRIGSKGAESLAAYLAVSASLTQVLAFCQHPQTCLQDSHQCFCFVCCCSSTLRTTNYAV